ncbi:MAG: hypothetical protein R2720_01995 [Candidatus Nanopelagicales bacterium]
MSDRVMSPGVSVSTPLFGKTFRSNSGGNALVRVKRRQVEGKFIGAVALIEAGNGQVVFCKAL